MSMAELKRPLSQRPDSVIFLFSLLATERTAMRLLSEDFVAKAERCEANAAATDNEVLRQQFLKAASMWLRLARVPDQWAVKLSRESGILSS